MEIQNASKSEVSDFIEVIATEVCSEALTKPSKEATFKIEDASKFKDLAHLVILIVN